MNAGWPVTHLLVSYWSYSGADHWCSFCGDTAQVYMDAGTLTDWLCIHCAAHHMRDNGEAFDDLEPGECACPPGRWEA